MKLKFKRVYETKNKIRFNEVKEDNSQTPIIGALYILKEIAGAYEEVEVDVTFIS